MQLIPIEKIVSNRDSIRKAREAFLFQKGRTIDPIIFEYYAHYVRTSSAAYRTSLASITF